MGDVHPVKFSASCDQFLIQPMVTQHLQRAGLQPYCLGKCVWFQGRVYHHSPHPMPGQFGCGKQACG